LGGGGAAGGSGGDDGGGGDKGGDGGDLGAGADGGCDGGSDGGGADGGSEGNGGDDGGAGARQIACEWATPDPPVAWRFHTRRLLLAWYKHPRGPSRHVTSSKPLTQSSAFRISDAASRHWA